jgi:hypothetical protein
MIDGPHFQDRTGTFLMKLFAGGNASFDFIHLGYTEEEING